MPHLNTLQFKLFNITQQGIQNHTVRARCSGRLVRPITGYCGEAQVQAFAVLHWLPHCESEWQHHVSRQICRDEARNLKEPELFATVGLSPAELQRWP